MWGKRLKVAAVWIFNIAVTIAGVAIAFFFWATTWM